MKHINSYLVKALDAYPCDLESTIESLQYALSADENNPMTLILLGRIYAEQFHDYNEAIRYFESAIAVDMENNIAYAELAKVFIQNEDYDKARKIIDFAMTLKSSNKDIIKARSVWLYEKQGLLKEASAELKALKLQVCHNDYSVWIEKCEARLKLKQAEFKKKNKKK
jgi:tetratricopeptide (TPR) repeat protein